MTHSKDLAGNNLIKRLFLEVWVELKAPTGDGDQALGLATAGS